MHMSKYDAALTPAAGLIRLARQKAGLTQTQLADEAGVHQQVISAYETGRRDPTVQMLTKLVGAAGYEVRMQLHPLDDHDRSIETFLETLPSESRKAVELRSRDRLRESRLRRVKGS